MSSETEQTIDDDLDELSSDDDSKLCWDAVWVVHKRKKHDGNDTVLKLTEDRNSN